MANDIFCDGVGRVTVTGPLVRMDLVSLSTTEKDAQGRPTQMPQGRLVMPVEAFLRTAAAMQQTIQQMVKAGVLTARPAEEQPAQPVNPS